MRFDFKFVVFLQNKTTWKASMCFVLFFFFTSKVSMVILTE